jgi:hypothetical protein
MMRNILSNSNSKISRAFIARSFGRECLSAKFFGCSGCILAARDRGFPLNLEQSRLTHFCIRVISSGYRCLSCVLQNAPRRVPDVFQTISPANVSFQFVSVLKRNWRALQCPTKVLKDLTK